MENNDPYVSHKKQLTKGMKNLFNQTPTEQDPVFPSYGPPTSMGQTHPSHANWCLAFGMQTTDTLSTMSCAISTLKLRKRCLNFAE